MKFRSWVSSLSITHAMHSNDLHRASKELGHVFLILFITIVLSIFLKDFTFLKGWEALYKGLLRFMRFALLLCLPLYLLLPIHQALGRIVRERGGALVQLEVLQQLGVRPLKHWLLRPFQGIGIVLFFATKLLTILQITTGQTVTASLLLPAGKFQLGRFLVVTGVTILVSLLLSTVWALDDMRVRYYNQKDQELKTIGKYVGTVVPIILGFYGIMALFSEFQMKDALFYLFQMVLILYPPFTVFAVLHSHFMQKRVSLFTSVLSLEKVRILHEKEIK